MRPARRFRAAPYRCLSATGQMCLWPESCAGWTGCPRQQDEPEPDEVGEGDEDLWGRIIGMIRRSQQEPGSETEPIQLEGPGAAAPVTSEEAAEYLARLEEEFPADQDEDNDA